MTIKPKSNDIWKWNLHVYVKGITGLYMIRVKYVMIQVVNWTMRFTVMAQRFQQMAATAGRLYRVIFFINYL